MRRQERAASAFEMNRSSRGVLRTSFYVLVSTSYRCLTSFEDANLDNFVKRNHRRR
jgi:hypothetical protein